MPNPSLTRRGVLGAAGAAAALVACREQRASTPVTTPVEGTPSASVSPDVGAPSGDVSTTTTAAAATTTVVEPTSAAAGDYFPPAHGGEWDGVSVADAGFTQEGVDALVELVRSANSQSFILLRHGRIVAEHYWAGADAEATLDIASCQKSVVSTLVGLARHRELLALDDTVSQWLGSGWSNAAEGDEAAITVQHLLTMTSGLAEDTLEVRAAPGAEWEYNTNAYQKLRRVLEAATGTGIEALTDEWLFTSIGASQQAKWAVRARAGADPVGDELWGLNLAARDMARYGLLAMRDGVWDGQRLVPEGWFAEAWAPIPQKRDYGYLWWLVGRGHLARLGIPTDTVAALGAQDQKIYVAPSAGLVLCRQGEAAGRVSATESDFDAALLTALLTAVA